MSACGCECCACDCEECCPPVELTPAQLAAARALEEERLAARMTPARDATAQLYRDIQEAEALMFAHMGEYLFGQYVGPRTVTGLDAAIPTCGLIPPPRPGP